MKKTAFLLVASMILLSSCDTKTREQVAAAVATVTATVEPTPLDTMSGYQLFELPYAYNALEPFIDAQTVALHYEKHTKGYFNKLIAGLRGTQWQGMTLEELFAKANKVPDALLKNAGQVYNHQLYFNNMSGDSLNGIRQPSGELLAAIDASFGSFEAFKDQFFDKAKSVFGSGWVFLAKDSKGKLFIASTPNHVNPLMNIAEKQGIPILACDVWEHSYYLKYQNRRPDYLDAFWSVINWKYVSELYTA